MSGVSRIIQSRQRRNRNAARSFTRLISGISITFLVLLVLVFSISIIYFSFFYADLLDELPPSEGFLPFLTHRENQQYDPTRIYDRTGQHLIAVLENPSTRGQKYHYLSQEDQPALPQELILATISSVEPNYWNNPGLSLESIYNTNRPTIAQKIIRLFELPENSRTDNQTVQEWILAAQIIDTYGHDQILEWYLNSEYYGNLAYGADAAARAYFGKPASKLNLAESATLVAAASSPTINPIDNPIASKEARDRILKKMFDQGLINQEQFNSAISQEIPHQSAEKFPVNLEPAYTSLVIQQLSNFIPEDRIFRGNLKIITSLDYELQSQVDCTVQNQLKRISGEGQNNQSTNNFENCEMARLLPSIPDIVERQDLQLGIEVLVMDPKEGQILAFNQSVSGDQTNNFSIGHPPGSIITPFIYLTSFTRGTSPATLLWDTPANIPAGIANIQDQDYQYHGPVNLRTALANDYLVPALQLLARMDPDQVWQTAARLGLTKLQVPPGDGTYKLLFEGGEADIKELSQAYGVLANQGILAGIPNNNHNPDDANSPILPQVILQVQDNSGVEQLNCTNPISECHPIKRPVLSQELAYLINDVLSDESARWPTLGHPNSLEIGRPTAAKIGKTNSNQGDWTIGYTPDLLASVWVGSQESSLRDQTPINWTADLWRAVFQFASKDYPQNDFPSPTNVNEIDVCFPSGMLPSKDCPQVVKEVFISGNEPTQVDNLYKTFQINSESGNLATIYTSPALIKEQVFLNFPPEAQEWAQENGIPEIPEDYDVLNIESIRDNNAYIISPDLFSTIKGVIPIKGRATGEEFISYRLQYGSGLNPEYWYQIGVETFDNVQNGQLGIWDTSQLSGLYVLQLLVSYEGDKVSSSTIQVTIDNEEPVIDIRYPHDGQTLNTYETGSITILADASDNLGIELVEVSIDGELLTSLDSPPFAVPWKITSGEHIIRVTAQDHAGNKNSSRVTIVVPE
jgi:membrane carboxypeptidase/penicillin-binding protein